MEKLQAELDRLISRLPKSKEIKENLATLISVYPFNEYEYRISLLLGSGSLTLDEYHILRDEYITRNLYLYLFEISAPRNFGELWAQGHLKELVPDMIKPTKKLDTNYSGQYDFLLDGKIRIEVKASRAVSYKTNLPLYLKALASDSLKNFDMNFQQIKPLCCDVFIWVGVWRDAIRYWVLASGEVASHSDFSKGQHRGNVGEGQLHINQKNINQFKNFECRSNKLLPAIRKAFIRRKKFP